VIVAAAADTITIINQ